MIDFRERGKEGERDWVKHLLVAFCMLPNWGLNLQPRHVPQPGIESAAIWFAGWRPTSWAIPARAVLLFVFFSIWDKWNWGVKENSIKEVTLFQITSVWLLAKYFTSLIFIFLKRDFIYLLLEREKEEERERNINVWLPLTCPLLGTWPTTQACALTGNWTSDPLVHRPVLNPLSHTRVPVLFFKIIKRHLNLYTCFLWKTFHYESWVIQLHPTKTVPHSPPPHTCPHTNFLVYL